MDDKGSKGQLIFYFWHLKQMLKFEKDEIGPLYILKGYSVYESAGMPERKRGIRTGGTEAGSADE